MMRGRGGGDTVEGLADDLSPALIRCSEGVLQRGGVGGVGPASGGGGDYELCEGERFV